MRVGWLADTVGYVGGAERTQEEFRAAAPRDVETVDCRPGRVDPDCDRYAVHNCLTYSIKDLKRTDGKPVVKYWNDTGGWYPPELRDWLDGNAAAVCCSELQVAHMGFDAAVLIPPPVDLAPFRQAAASMNGRRRGTVSVAQWRQLTKGQGAVMAWAHENGCTVDFYGGGPYAPPASREIVYRGMPGLLARYERFVFLPQVLEPFGRLVAEAWAAGCEIVTNKLVGAVEWLKNDPEAIERAAEDYWKLVFG